MHINEWAALAAGIFLGASGIAAIALGIGGLVFASAAGKSIGVAFVVFGVVPLGLGFRVFRFVVQDLATARGLKKTAKR